MSGRGVRLFFARRLEFFRVVWVKNDLPRVRVAEELRLCLQLVYNLFCLIRKLLLIVRLAGIDYRPPLITMACRDSSGLIV